MTEPTKNITNGRLLKNNGSWMYCNQCNKTVGYLCYSTYQDFQFNFICNCGNEGRFKLAYSTEQETETATEVLKLNKKRLCCPNDDSPLFTIVEKNIKEVNYRVVCKKCRKEFAHNVK